LKEVIDLLEWESEKVPVAVILHNFGVVGKTILPNVSLSWINIEGCKYSMIGALENIDSTPKIIELQKCILKDMMELEKPIPEIYIYKGGEIELSVMVQKVPAFIYIDNVFWQRWASTTLTKRYENSKEGKVASHCSWHRRQAFIYIDNVFWQRWASTWHRRKQAFIYIDTDVNKLLFTLAFIYIDNALCQDEDMKIVWGCFLLLVT